ncbi:MAG TPA: hypothetical protein VF088_17920 [Pyrinomonadaceae bacterium]
MTSITLKDDRIHVGERFSFTLQRTLRLPDDGKTYPLPPGLGAFPVLRVSDYEDKVPQRWREQGGFFVPLYQREALWLQFEGAWWKPNAVKVSVGGINAVSGETWNEELRSDPQNYIVCPDQPWLDGINIGESQIRQFVATPLGRGDTIEEQLTGSDEWGGLQLQVFEPRPGVFPDQPPAPGPVVFESLAEGEVGMGIGAGGRMEQKIYPDSYGLEAWDPASCTQVLIHIVNSEQYFVITGREPPPSPVSAQLYTNMNLPWFQLYDEDRADLPPSERLKTVKALKERELERGSGEDDSESLKIDPNQIIHLKSGKKPT